MFHNWWVDDGENEWEEGAWGQHRRGWGDSGPRGRKWLEDMLVKRSRWLPENASGFLVKLVCKQSLAQQF